MIYQGGVVVYKGGVVVYKEVWWSIRRCGGLLRRCGGLVVSVPASSSPVLPGWNLGLGTPPQCGLMGGRSLFNTVQCTVYK